MQRHWCLHGPASASHGIPGLRCWGAGGGLGASLCVRAALGCLLGSGRRGCECGEGADVACHPLSSQPVICSLWPHPSACSGPGSGVGRELGLPRGGWAPQMGPQVPMYAHARASLGPVYTQKETEAWRWGSPAAIAQSTPMAPQALHSAVPGCAGRHALGGRGGGRNIPPVCRPAQAGAGSSWPRPVAPLPGSNPGRGWPCAGTGGALMWLGPGLSSSPVSLPKQEGEAGRPGCRGH